MKTHESGTQSKCKDCLQSIANHRYLCKRKRIHRAGSWDTLLMLESLALGASDSLRLSTSSRPHWTCADLRVLDIAGRLAAHDFTLGAWNITVWTAKRSKLICFTLLPHCTAQHPAMKHGQLCAKWDVLPAGAKQERTNCSANEGSNHAIQRAASRGSWLTP